MSVDYHPLRLMEMTSIGVGYMPLLFEENRRHAQSTEGGKERPEFGLSSNITTEKAYRHHLGVQSDCTVFGIMSILFLARKLCLAIPL